MKKILLLFCFLFFGFHTSFSQGVWTWVKGSDTANVQAKYGTQGVPALGNTPQALVGICEWTDAQGNFWLFGGEDYKGNMYNDLWKYDDSANNWTWIKGPGIPNNQGNYGTKGVPSSTNLPLCDGYGSASWVDLNGDFWMYDFNALWRYNIASNIWTWVQGTTGFAFPVFGTKGIPSPTNSPGSDWEGCATWVDSTGNLWLFGGIAIANTAYNTLWKYEIKSNEWTWMSGSDSSDRNGTYGTLGIANPSNVPGARLAYCSWKDSKNEFWLFGGADANSNYFNDMWKYDPSNNEWTWMSGTNSVNDSGKYGPACSHLINLLPASRVANSTRWVDDCGRFWMYGGAGKSYQDTIYNIHNDLWNFDPTTLKWMLASGGSARIAPVYGIMGVPNLANQPGGRLEASSWKGNDGALYFFGGEGINYNPAVLYNDVWKYQPDPSCSGASYAGFGLGNDTAYCGSFSRVLSTSDTSTRWSIGVTASQIIVTTPGKYWATVNTGCGIASDTITIGQGVYAGIIDTTKEIICTGSSVTLTVSGGAGNIQWQSSIDGISFNNIPGANSSVYISSTLSQNTFYRVKETGSCGTDSSASKMVVVSPAPVAGVVTALPDSVCATENIISTLKTDTSFGHLQWQSSKDGINFTDITGDTLNTYTTSPTYFQTIYYRITASTNCAIDTSNVAPVQIVDFPKALFFASSNGKQVTFTLTGTSSGVTYHWDFGDGTTSNLPNPVHTYNDSILFFNACLTVANNIGCADTFCSGGNLISTGTKDILKPVFLNLYPNPANNTINLAVDGLTGSYELKIYNVLGQTVGAIHELALNSNKIIPIDINKLIPGTYELMLSNNLQYFSKRFVHVK